MKTTALIIGTALVAPAVIALDLLIQAVADSLAPLGALPALVIFGALITALIRFTR